MTWTKTEIRAARQLELAPRLEKRGLTLGDRGGGNYEVEQYRVTALGAERDLTRQRTDRKIVVLALARRKSGGQRH